MQARRDVKSEKVEPPTLIEKQCVDMLKTTSSFMRPNLKRAYSLICQRETAARIQIASCTFLSMIGLHATGVSTFKTDAPQVLRVVCPNTKFTSANVTLYACFTLFLFSLLGSKREQIIEEENQPGFAGFP